MRKILFKRNVYQKRNHITKLIKREIRSREEGFETLQKSKQRNVNLISSERLLNEMMKDLKETRANRFVEIEFIGKWKSNAIEKISKSDHIRLVESLKDTIKQI
jgi:hypothetical protein